MIDVLFHDLLGLASILLLDCLEHVMSDPADVVAARPQSVEKKRAPSRARILLAEDTTGRGHISRAVDDQPRASIFITLD